MKTLSLTGIALLIIFVLSLSVRAFVAGPAYAPMGVAFIIMAGAIIALYNV